MDGIGESFSIWRSGITGDKRLMTNIWLGTKDLLNVDFIIFFLCVCASDGL